MKLSDIDKFSVLLSSFGIFIFVLGILSLNVPKEWIFSLIMMAVGIILLIIFYLREKKIISRNEIPFTDIRLFKDRNFTLGSLTRLIMQLALAGAVFVLPVFLQQVTGSDAFTTGLAILPLTIGLLVFSLASSRLSNKYITTLPYFNRFSNCSCWQFFPELPVQLKHTYSDIIPGTLLLGIGLGLALPITGNIVLSSAEDDKQSDASGILSTSVNFRIINGYCDYWYSFHAWNCKRDIHSSPSYISKRI